MYVYTYASISLSLSLYIYIYIYQLVRCILPLGCPLRIPFAHLPFLYLVDSDTEAPRIVCRSRIIN